MVLLSLTFCLVVGANPEENPPNQSLSITSVQSPDTASPTSEEVSAPANARNRRITPRSGQSLFDRTDPDENAQKLDANARQRTWWITTAIGLVIVLAVILTASRALKKLVPGLNASDTQAPIHLIYRTYLAPKQSICLLRCGSRLLLVGVTNETMQTLAEFTDPEEIDHIKGMCMQVKPNSASKAFRDAFSASEQKWQTEARPEKKEKVARAEPPQPTTNPEELTKQLGQLRERILSFRGRESEA